ncbi:flagellar hook protein FlgE [Gluconacetobacter johannae DSM 13595]|uniref:Flagellar hook protein FlgE n=1 Tax=Gluconacetobacter johannae TaxID=112140 RepID=A0A7W4P6J3_9PROT|nr:flagellar hook-basal body complex protein [Gluconacetobacter johannae]MBB2177313.1 flagellar hook-basal body complex protein [Gluconacetobacter johannae]GBQ82628.1 flagellar hook protein FlgE [Gluconacetobacter johannae DSM 13595]
MSVFNALSTAVSGINAQSTAFTNLSNNIANSQTVGYKANSTAFQDFVAGSMAGSSASQDVSDSVSAVTVQHVSQQGTASASTDDLAMAISGSGLFDVSKETGEATSGTTQFENRQYYTRNGEFYENKAGYLVNTSGYYLDGYQVDPTTGALGTSLTQLNIANIAFRPTETTTLTLSAAVGTLPSSTSTGPYSQSYTTAPATTYDANGNASKVALTWTQSSTNPLVWDVSAYDAEGTGKIASNDFQVTFDSNGALASVTGTSDGAPYQSSTLSGASVEPTITSTNSNGISQNITLDLGTIGGTSGTTMAAATGTPSTAQASGLTADTTADTLTMASTALGTTTGSQQTYMTTPTDVGGTPVSAVWTQTSAAPPTWTVQAVDPYDTSATSPVSSAPYSVVFNADGTTTVTDISNPASPVAVPGGLGALSATVSGTTYAMDLSGASLSATALSTDSTALTSDSVASGTYQGAEIQDDGSVMAVFDNGDTQLIGKVALTNFANVDGLNAVDGQAYTATASSGTARTGTVGENGTGSLSVGYVESSTTDLTSDLSALIVAQEAYSANTKVVTTADQLLQSTIAMKQ